MKPSLLLWLFQTLPESLASASLAVVLCAGKIVWKRIFLIGLPFAVAVYLVRSLPFAFGVHFIVLTIIMAMLLTVWLKIPFSRGLLTAFIVGIILAVIETVSVYLFITLTGIAIDQTIQYLHTHIVFAWPHIIVLFLLALAINWWKKNHPAKGQNFDE